MKHNNQLISYIAPGAPATRKPATGNEPFFRIEAGFTPKWFNSKLDIDFGEKWHNDPAYRKNTVITMNKILEEIFPGKNLGRKYTDETDFLTGTFGACTIAAMFGAKLLYYKDNWINCEHLNMDEETIKQLKPLDCNNNPFLEKLLQQIEWIANEEGCVNGFINWQGILNNALRLRGDMIFFDMMENKGLVKHLFECICITMINSIKKIQQIQNNYSPIKTFCTISNCMVNMVSPELYNELLKPFDKRLSEEFGIIGIHNCAWKADPYLEYYSGIPNVGYIDMGFESDLNLAKKLFPDARRSLMYTPMDLKNKNMEQLEKDFDKIACELGPCDLVCADIDIGMEDTKVMDIINLAEKISSKFDNSKTIS